MFGEVAHYWLQDKAPRVKETTLCNYRLILKTYLLPRFETATQIGEEEVQQFIIDKAKAGLSKKTIRDVVATLKAIVTYGAKRRLFATEPWDLYYPETIRGAKRMKVMDISHQRKLINHLTAEPTHRNIGVLIAICTGMRIGEVCALEWEDVDLTHRVIRVNKTMSSVYDCATKTCKRIISTPKTKNSFREIPISPALYHALCTVRRQSNIRFVVGDLPYGTSQRNYRDTFDRLLKRLKIPRITFHGLRHTFATRCIESKADYKTVSALLGHANVATTLNLYVHPNLDQKKRCVAQMFKYLS